MSASFARYLAAKRTVDDRALNRPVWHALQAALPAATPAAPLRLLEVGCGIGTMIERLVEWELLTAADVTAIDAEPANIAVARQRLPLWAAAHGLTATTDAAGRLHWADARRQVGLELEAIDLFDFLERNDGRRAWDLLIAHAVLDLLDIPAVLSALCGLVGPGGLLYLTITFDGGTLLQPEIERDYDDLVEARYHRTMDARITDGRPSGDSRAGRHLFGHLRAAGATVLAGGSSDWVVFGGPDGYPADEAFFLRFIIDTMQGALQADPLLDPARFAAWIAARHAQIERGELVYIAHQLDFLARVDA